MAAVAGEVRYKHSNKVMNHMDAETALVHARLRFWAIEVSNCLSILGLPTESSYHRWAALQIAPQKGHEPDLSEKSARVDRAIAKLPEIDRAVIERYYRFYRPGDALWRGIHGISSKHNFETVLRRARFRVSGYLLAVE